MTNPEVADNVGIIAMEIYFPSMYVAQEELEKFDGVTAGKYIVGLGQEKMSFVGDNEDIYSMSLTVVQQLLEKYQISPLQIGRLEVGTETVLDKSKSVKSVLMQLFSESGNTDLQGVDNINACYGGTAAIFNSLAWMESKECDGRLALVVAGDIAVYAPGPARPTGGAGAIALLLGPKAPISFERGLSATHMEHVYDFYKPNLDSEYPEVDGKLSVSCYLRAVDVCYNRYLQKLSKLSDEEIHGLGNFDYFLFHSPYTKLVQKSVARLAFNDFLRDPQKECYSKIQHLLETNTDDSYFSKEIEKTFMTISESSFLQMTSPSLLLPKNLGNIYCGSLYSCLLSLVCLVDDDLLLAKRIGMFSYGSGSAATMFSLRITSSLEYIRERVNLIKRLESRTSVAPEYYTKIMKYRETMGNHSYKPVLNDDHLALGTFYLTEIDSKCRRSYERK